MSSSPSTTKAPSSTEAAGSTSDTAAAASKPIKIAFVAVLVHLALVIGLWAARPLEDSVPVGLDWSPTVQDPPEPQRLVSQDVECNTLFASSARPDEPLPTLAEQPEGRPALDYQRDPCELVQRQARIVFGLDVLFTAGALTALVWITRRLRHRDVTPA